MPLRLVKRNGSSQWYLRGTVRGQHIFETTGTDQKKAAEQIRVRREAQLLDASIHGRRATVTFAEAASSYLDNGGSPRFLGRFDAASGSWSGLIGHFGTRKLNTITQNDLDAAANKLYPGTQPQTRNRQCHAVFVAVWNHAHLNGWCDARKWRRPRLPKGTKVKFIQAARPARAGSKPTTYERAAKFVLAMSPAPAMLMTALFYTGMRPIEVFTLEDNQVSIPKRWISLPATKSGEPRGVPIHEALIPLLEGLMTRGGFLFRTPRGQPYEPKEDGGGQMKTAILGARRRSGITDISPYTGRHTVSTQLVVNGIHPFIKDQILGHAVTDMSRNYTDVPVADLIDAINSLPIIEDWANAPWMLDPLPWVGRLAEGTGKRNDLVKDESLVGTRG